MASFPTLQGGYQVPALLEETFATKTTVITFCDDTRQRWQCQKPLRGFLLKLTNVNKVDADAVLAFWKTTKGDFDATWDIAVRGTTYHNMVFVDSTLTITEKPGLLFDLSAKVRQTA